MLANVYFTRREDGKFNYKRLVSSTAFELAPTFVVVRRTRSNFFRSKSWDEVVYSDRGLTGEDVRDVMAMLLPRVALMMTEAAS